LQQFDLTKEYDYYCDMDMLNVIIYALYCLAIVYIVAGLLYILISHIYVVIGAVIEKNRRG
jgi:hypothetical protein